MNWVKLEKYCELSGDTPDAVQKKIRRGIWLMDQQARKAPDGRIWINLQAVEAWVQNGLQSMTARAKQRRAA